MVISGFWVYMVAIAALLWGGAGVSAQDAPANCGGLSESDCSILSESQAVMETLESAAIKFNLDMTFSGIPQMPASATINLSGDARYAVTDAETLQNFTANMTDDPAGAMEDLFKAFALDSTFILQLPADLVDESRPNRGAFSLRLVDGFAYMNVDKMMALIGETGSPNGWMGLDLAGLYGRILSQMGSANIPRQSAAADMMSDLVTIERRDDAELDGQTLAAFHYTVDYSELASNEAFMSLLRDQFESTGMMGQVNMDALMDFYAEAFAGLTLEMTQLVGLDDHYVHNLSLQMDWTLDMAALGELFGGASDAVPDITIHLSANADLSQFNAAAPIEAPADATILPLDSLVPAVPRTFEFQQSAA